MVTNVKTTILLLAHCPCKIGYIRYLKYVLTNSVIFSFLDLALTTGCQLVANLLPTSPTASFNSGRTIFTL